MATLNCKMTANSKFLNEYAKFADLGHKTCSNPVR